MDLLNALLDLADAISAAVALVGFWYTWCCRRTRTLPLPMGASAPDELEQFLRAATLEQTVAQAIALGRRTGRGRDVLRQDDVSRARAQMG